MRLSFINILKINSNKTIDISRKTIFEKKPRIAVLIHGEIRTNSLGKGTNDSFVYTFKNCFLTDKIINNYEVNIFFVVDKCIPEKVYDYFGVYLKGLLQLDKENIKEPLNVQQYIDNYMYYYDYRNINTEKFPYPTRSREIQLYSEYKRYCAWYLMQEYEKLVGIKYNYIFTTRPDVYFTNDIFNYIKELENGKQLLNHHDWGFFGKNDIMCHLLKIIFVYGKYMYNEIDHPNEVIDKLSHSVVSKYKDICKNIWPCWRESAECQVFEHLLQYYYINNLASEDFGNMNIIVLYHDRREHVDWD